LRERSLMTGLGMHAVFAMSAARHGTSMGRRVGGVPASDFVIRRCPLKGQQDADAPHKAGMTSRAAGLLSLHTLWLVFSL
jgi:hypothetical protein